MPRSNDKKQKELVQVETTYEEFMTQMHLFLPIALNHLWLKKWDQQNRLVHGIVLFTDFSANYECRGQDIVTCGTCATANQLVIIVHHSQKVLANGDREMVNDSWHFWGAPEKGKLESNFSYYNYCVQHILNHYKQHFITHNKQLQRVWINSDGCAAQFKSRKNMWNLIQLLKNNTNLLEIIHTFAPMGCFKCEVDSSGGFCKKYLRNGEKIRTFRAPTAAHAFKVISDPVNGIGQPHPPSDKTTNKLMAIHSRSHRLLVHQESREQLQHANIPSENNTSLIFTTFDDINPCELPAITKHYQYRVSSTDNNNTTPDANIINYRVEQCWCTHCIANNYDQCQHKAETGSWSKFSMYLNPVVARKAASYVDRVFQFYHVGGKSISVILATYVMDIDAHTTGNFNKSLHLYVQVNLPSTADSDQNDISTEFRQIHRSDKYITCRKLMLVPGINANVYTEESTQTIMVAARNIVIPNAPTELKKKTFINNTNVTELIPGSTKHRTLYTVCENSLNNLNELITATFE
jgi:hypothetical protein